MSKACCEHSKEMHIEDGDQETVPYCLICKFGSSIVGRLYSETPWFRHPYRAADPPAVRTMGTITEPCQKCARFPCRCGYVACSRIGCRHCAICGRERWNCEGHKPSEPERCELRRAGPGGGSYWWHADPHTEGCPVAPLALSPTEVADALVSYGLDDLTATIEMQAESIRTLAAQFAASTDNEAELTAEIERSHRYETIVRDGNIRLVGEIADLNLKLNAAEVDGQRMASQTQTIQNYWDKIVDLTAKLETSEMARRLADEANRELAADLIERGIDLRKRAEEIAGLRKRLAEAGTEPPIDESNCSFLHPCSKRAEGGPCMHQAQS